MRDPRFQALAAQLASPTALRPGDRVLLELTDIPEEMGNSPHPGGEECGAMPFLLNQSRLNRGNAFQSNGKNNTASSAATAPGGNGGHGRLH